MAQPRPGRRPCQVGVVTTVRKLALPAALAWATVLVPTTAAAAAEPEQTGWWNRLSAGGVVLPQPMAQEGDLRVASSPSGPSAYAAVLYSAPGASSATLVLEVRSRQGTAEVVVCPTETTDWPEGGNQPYDKAPAFDCDLGQAFGSPSEDGKTLSFMLDTSTQTEPGVWSLALAPSPDSDDVFLLDIVAPGPESFQAGAPEVSSDTGGSVDPGTTTTDSTTSGGGGPGEAFLPGGFETPPAFDLGTAQAPLVAGGADAALPEAAAAPAPAVATNAAPAATPLLVATPAGVVEDLGAGGRLLALLVLAAGSAAVGYAAGQQRPGPRLIGGRSRLGAPALATAVPAGEPSAEERPRGIGRFAKAREEAPRRLR
jgi:hypothetical protein